MHVAYHPSVRYKRRKPAFFENLATIARKLAPTMNHTSDNPPDIFGQVVSTCSEIASIIGTPSEAVIKKELTSLDDAMQVFLAASPFVLVGTVAKDGQCDVSPRGDLPAVATVLDAQHLVLPEWRGNRRADSLRNIIQTKQCGLLFMIPGLKETLRVNGRAWVIREEAVLSPLAKQGKTPLLGIGVEVQQCFFQCGKAVIRSRLWQAGDHDPPPFDFADVLATQIKQEGLDASTLRKQIEESYRERLY